MARKKKQCGTLSDNWIIGEILTYQDRFNRVKNMKEKID